MTKEELKDRIARAEEIQLYTENRCEALEKENAELRNKLTAIRKAKDKYDLSKDKSIIKAFGAEYTLFCALERILEDWQEDDQLSKAKEHIKQLLDCLKQDTNDPETNYYVCQYMDKAEQFIKEIEK